MRPARHAVEQVRIKDLVENYVILAAEAVRFDGVAAFLVLQPPVKAVRVKVKLLKILVPNVREPG